MKVAAGSLVGALLVGLVLSSCSSNGSSSTSPTLTGFSISGTLTSITNGRPLAATLDFSGTTTTSDSAGRFTVSGPAQLLSLTISGPGVITRHTLVNGANGPRTLNLDAITDDGFDLGFYRQLVRNAAEQELLRPLARWVRNPSFYLNTEGIDSVSLDNIEALIRESVSSWSGNTLSVAAVERGTGSRTTDGWITVQDFSQAGLCGLATISVNGGGTVMLNYANSGCRCAGTIGIGSRVVRHEVGHAMGFFHAGVLGEVMFGNGGFCDSQLSARERLHAAIAYKRVNGNLDIDTDPSGTTLSTPSRISVQ